MTALHDGAITLARMDRVAGAGLSGAKEAPGARAIQSRSILTLVLLTAFAAGCGRPQNPPPTPTTEQLLYGRGDVIHARAVGNEYEWRFIAAGIDGEPATPDDVPLGAELYLPAGKAVQLHFESRDYVYTFLQPDLNINEMAVPGIPAAAQFVSPAEGSFEISTSPLCGFMFAHADYRPFIRIGIPDDLKFDEPVVPAQLETD